MNDEEKIKMFKDVFAPKPGEKVLFLVDLPYGSIKDNKKWIDRRKMASEWFETFQKIGNEIGFSVDLLEYNATGLNNTPIPENIKDSVRKNNLVLALTEFSATSSLKPICNEKGTITRCASMPGIERRMEKSAFQANYADVKIYALALQRLLNDSVGAEIEFSTGDTLYIDLRNREASADKGECNSAGQSINFPSGEGFKAPYEAADDEKNVFGESKTEGVLPVSLNGEITKFIIKNNKIIEVKGNSSKAVEMRDFFAENETRRNIAELGLGCNPKAVITGNVLEDEKVGLHIAYGMSSQLGGKIKSDMHQDICYSKGCPVEGTSVFLIDKDGNKTEIIKNSELRYELL